MSNIPGCFNIGESDFQYHGANRLGANSLLSCIFAGLVVGNEIPRYLESLQTSCSDIPSKVFEASIDQERQIRKELLNRNGSENVHALHDELAVWMVANATVKRNNTDLQRTIHKIHELKDRYQNISLDDRSQFANQTYAFALQFDAMLDLSLVIAK